MLSHTRCEKECHTALLSLCFLLVDAGPAFCHTCFVVVIQPTPSMSQVRVWLNRLGLGKEIRINHSLPFPEPTLASPAYAQGELTEIEVESLIQLKGCHCMYDLLVWASPSSVPSQMTLPRLPKVECMKAHIDPTDARKLRRLWRPSLRRLFRRR